jgi:hypothetical protein
MERSNTHPHEPEITEFFTKAEVMSYKKCFKSAAVDKWFEPPKQDGCQRDKKTKKPKTT